VKNKENIIIERYLIFAKQVISRLLRGLALSARTFFLSNLTYRDIENILGIIRLRAFYFFIAETFINEVINIDLPFFRRGLIKHLYKWVIYIGLSYKPSLKFIEVIISMVIVDVYIIVGQYAVILIDIDMPCVHNAVRFLILKDVLA
jgi:hypothetical protein